MHGHFVPSQVEFVVKDNESGHETLDIMAQKMLLIKVTLQTFVIFEELVVQTLFFTDVALVMVLVQVLMQKGQIIKPFGSTKLADRMSRKSRHGSIPLFQMIL